MVGIGWVKAYRDVALQSKSARMAAVVRTSGIPFELNVFLAAVFLGNDGELAKPGEGNRHFRQKKCILW